MTTLKRIETRLARAFELVLESRIFLPFLALLSLSAVWGVTYYLISIEHTNAKRTSSALSSELTETYEAQILRNLGIIDSSLKIIKHAYESDERAFSLTVLEKKELLPPSLVFAINVVDRNGKRISSNQPAASAMGIGQKLVHAHQEKRSRGLIINSYEAGPPGAGIRLYFSRRLVAQDGTLSGVVSISVDSGYFTSGYDPSKMGQKGVLALISKDGTFWEKRTGDHISSGGRSGDIPPLSDNDRQMSALANSWDIEPRYIHMRQIHGFPLIVTVGLSEDEQFAAFHGRRRTYLWEAFGVSVFILLISVAIGRLARQLSESRLQTRKVHESYTAKILEQLDDRARFLAAASHDLRTPLTRMKLRIESLRDEQSKEWLHRDAREMAEVLDMTLNYMRDEAQPAKIQLLDVNALAQSMSDDAKDLGHELNVTGSARPISVEAIAFRSCVSNLIQNALRYGGGAQMYLKDSEESLTIEIHDRGPGIPEDKLVTVFEPFVRLEPAGINKNGGFGLGLSIAKAAARKNGGELTLHNGLEGGLVARLVIPREVP